MEYLKQIIPLSALNAVKNELCKNHTLMTIEHLLQGSPWAMKMFDSSTKFPEGVLEGSIFHLGNYDECLEVNVNQDWGSFKGQHCMVTVDMNVSHYLPAYEAQSLPSAIPFKWAICVPSSCVAADVEDFFTTALHYTVNVNPLECHIQGPRPFLPVDWLAIIILSFFGLLCVLSTAYDLIVTDPWSRRESLVVFSWYTNGKRLLNTDHSDNTLHCLHGIRFLTINWVVLGHAYVTEMFSPIVNLLYVTINWVVLGHAYFTEMFSPEVNLLDTVKSIKDWGHIVILSAVLSVDTFFLISGTLLCYIFMMTGGRNFNYLIYFLHRYMRTTPMMAILILVYTGIILHMATGPLWDSFLQIEVAYCKNNWWTAILHLQNYINPSEMCISATWYLNVDMQLYLLSPLLLLPLVKRPKIGLILLQVVTAASIVTCFLQMYFHRNEITDFLKGEPINANYYYTHTRASPWFIGISLGYCLFHTIQWKKDIAAGKRRNLSKKVLVAGWLLGAVCLLTPILVLHEIIQDDNYYHSIKLQVYAALSRPIWSMGVSWVIFVCVAGYGGPVNKFLSWKFFHPMSRLTYSIYMLHMFFMRIKMASTKTPLYSDDMEKIEFWFSTMVFTTLLAIPASLTFESPIIKIQKMLLGDRLKQKNQTEPEVSNTSQHEEKRNNDPLPGSVVIPGSSISQELNTLPKYPSNLNTSEENSAHNGTQ
ncbi:O-acyltransferase like protein-like isoform X2 [Zootermopsis nevadensis]|uniref:O-acyltransferase like protein-like isoform X2 n=1 Tax=Zootermopsis nevadensis TaxID=136037 RepID=UPI000B8EB35C|nr:O-acyltransferase like protein-like isoform X2 [Zootermopsis nevadensis]